ncbi:hypothetical protein pneo_cds_777 [Pandoravirus neocaledonia]|uniref:Uncharacterized protein n=1 Tax=Pandoravirus neocaledonia TaxID=2107708 RepID=A0A2U7UD61_9VIRU|nr:hypothetical protein pneo_cds_777 [Pandoravirus neocaledonia]AVK76384.1 hypothetical protein pneo_cds_777 [Pandoravirus neocaledonia]
MDTFRRRLATRYPVFGPFVHAPATIDGVVLAGGAFMLCLDAKTFDTEGRETDIDNGDAQDDIGPSDINLWVYGKDADARARALDNAGQRLRLSRLTG